MANLNKVFLIGRLTQDPDFRQTSSGIPVARFTLAINRRFTKGEENTADFIEVVVWRNNAEFVNKYFKKGAAAFVSGSIQVNTWQDKESGQNRKKYEVVADEVQFAESKRDNSFEPKNETAAFSSMNSDFEEVGDDDLPF